MSQTKVSSHLLENGAAQENLNAGESITLTKPIVASNQNDDSDDSVMTRNLVYSTMNKSVRALYVSNTGYLQNSQFAGQGSLGFANPVTVGQSTHRLTYAFPLDILSSLTQPQNAGGYHFTWAIKHSININISTFASSTALDNEVKIAFGNIAVTGTNSGRISGIGSGMGYILKMTKHPTNNSYVLRLGTKLFGWSAETNISGASNTSPIVITTPANHLLSNNDVVELSKVAGNTAANGEWVVTVLSNTTFSLNNSNGNGNYTSGGVLNKYTTNTVEINPRLFYDITFVWEADLNTVNLYVNGNLSLSIFSYTGSNLETNTYQVGYQLHAGLASITSNSTLGFQISPPLITILP